MVNFTFKSGSNCRVSELSPQLLTKAWRLGVQRYGARNPRLRRQGESDLKSLALEWKRRAAFTPEKHDVLLWHGRQWRVSRVWLRTIRMVPVSHSPNLKFIQYTCYVPVASGGFFGARLASPKREECPW